jgi:hypothetical protein
MQAWSKISRMPAAGIKKLQDELLQKMIKEVTLMKSGELTI